ncbi:MAG: hypothetical protein KJ822_07050, partial [Proteobacteria bacterium]|nr:hypothetical protein [Pseudomonadota bacterium]
MGSISSGLILILLLFLSFLGMIFYIAWKTDKIRWLLWLLPFVFVGGIFFLAWSQDHDFWRSTHSLY